MITYNRKWLHSLLRRSAVEDAGSAALPFGVIAKEATTHSPERSLTRAWLVTVMLIVLALVNWMDKAVLGLVAVPLMKDLNIGPGEYGVLASSIYFLFSISAASVGFLANKRSVKWLLMIMVTVWSITQFSIWMAPTFGVILVSRIILGFAEGPSAGLSFFAATKWFRDDERNLPIALQNMGAFGGIAVAAPGLTWVISNYNWHWAFFTVGAVGLVWMAIWLFIGKEGPYTGSSKATASTSIFDTDVRIPYKKLLLNRTYVGTICVGFAAYWALAIVASWLPAYLRLGQGYTPQVASTIVMKVSLTAIFFLILLAVVTQALMNRGASTRVARGFMASGSVALSGLFVIASVMTPPGALQTTLLCIGFGLGLVTFTTGAVIISEFVPVLQRGAVLGIYVATLTLSGIVCPAVFGGIVQSAGGGIAGYHVALVISGIFISIGGLSGFLLINPQREIRRITQLAKAM